jgi:hypothetical protein
MESASALLGRFVLDLRTVVGRWVGPQKPAFSARSPRAWRVPGPAQTAGLGGRELEIVGRSAAGAGAVTLTLRDPSGAKIRFTPGQFFSVLVEVDGAPLRRAYSAASSALVEETIELTIKEVEGGRVSGLFEQVGAGGRSAAGARALGLVHGDADAGGEAALAADRGRQRDHADDVDRADDPGR